MNHARIAYATAHVTARVAVTAFSLAACAAMAIGSAVAAVPAEQLAVVQAGSGGPETLHLRRIPVPEPAEGQVLIRVYAASVNPADWTGLTQAPAAGQTQRVPGLDAAGVIAAVGPGVTDLSVGMPVFAIVDHSGLNGGYAHYVLAKAAGTAPKPKNVSYAQAAGLGVVGVTALRALDDAQVHAGQSVLITGVAGGVGSTAAQIAQARGAVVLGTASPRHAAYLRRIGVSKVIDYAHGNIAEEAGQVDVVIDTVGGSEAIQAFQAIKPGGRFLSVARAELHPGQCATARVRCFGSPGHAADASNAVLRRIGELAGDGNLRVHVDRTFPLSEAARALKYSHQGHAEGKVILTVVAGTR